MCFDAIPTRPGRIIRGYDSAGKKDESHSGKESPIAIETSAPARWCDGTAAAVHTAISCNILGTRDPQKQDLNDREVSRIEMLLELMLKETRVDLWKRLVLESGLFWKKARLGKGLILERSSFWKEFERKEMWEEGNVRERKCERKERKEGNARGRKCGENVKTRREVEKDNLVRYWKMFTVTSSTTNGPIST